MDIYASSGVTDGQGSFGYVIYVREDQFDEAARAQSSDSARHALRPQTTHGGCGLNRDAPMAKLQEAASVNGARDPRGPRGPCPEARFCQRTRRPLAGICCG